MNLPEAKFEGQWETVESLLEDFQIEASDIPGQIIYAEYDIDGYEGQSMVLGYDEKLGFWETYGSHCSCYGLEDQFKPEYVTLEVLRHRFGNLRNGKYGDFLQVRGFGYLFDYLDKPNKTEEKQGMINVPKEKRLFVIYEHRDHGHLSIAYANQYVYDWLKENCKQYYTTLTIVEGVIWLFVNPCYDVEEIVKFIESNCKLSDSLFPLTGNTEKVE